MNDGRTPLSSAQSQGFTRMVECCSWSMEQSKVLQTVSNFSSLVGVRFELGLFIYFQNNVAPVMLSMNPATSCSSASSSTSLSNNMSKLIATCNRTRDLPSATFFKTLNKCKRILKTIYALITCTNNVICSSRTLHRCVHGVCVLNIAHNTTHTCICGFACRVLTNDCSKRLLVVARWRPKFRLIFMATA